ncbi:A disintegrin and metalloproteinase with thrombospondin motifs 6 [Holothuria leucospilota]|uniref:A disintegrin and metalloproteinase with thrombospondin motifs 6 n=1 Tax=Holothuria leucospilota TaxID=206669 RepID=A0A9Q1BBQ5_HOLLE|nr:A disintegrin and metalloproteinase with thrombospondin motifs 6 [Holothuria leucospilota]
MKEEMSPLKLRLLFSCAVFITYVHHGMARVTFDNDDLKAYDTFPDKIHDYDVVFPSVLHHNRYKRDTQSTFTTKLKLQAFGEDLHLTLFSSERFFRPDLEVTYINPDNTVTKKPLGLSRDCFYQGFSPTHNYSRAVITMCDDDVYGYVDQGGDGIFITPLNEEHTKEYARQKRSTGRPHLIYRRALNEDEFCPVKYESELDPVNRGHDGIFAEQATEEYTPPKYMEVLLILDVDFVTKRGPDTETYAMALMHVASRRYVEPSLDVTMRLYIVDVIALSTDSATIYGNPLSLSSNGETTLDSLRAWNAASFIANGESGHWDNAIIVSGKDLLTSDGNPGLLGIASILGTCIIGEGASVNEDTGLSGGLTIAHEVGHTLTLVHDEDAGCQTPSGFVMSTFARSTPNAFFWSTCSSFNLKIYFRSPASDCMDNIPFGLDALPVLVLPGQMYDLDQQCIQAYGDGVETCDSLEVSCEALQCTAGGDCIETFRTTAEGTPCGEDMICLGAQCVPSDSVPQPENGGWSSWTEWECSRTCGCGVLRRQRLCDNPKTQWGGAHCVGEGTENTLCNCNSCGNTPDDHRNEQCAASDDVPLDGILYSWVALFGNFIDEIFYCQNPCQTTLPTGYLRPPFENVDGTDCWDHEISDWSTLQKCVSGICQEFGCDGVQGSTKSFDSCRICNSDGSTCSQTTDSFASGTLSIFNDIVTIPEGATSVVITNNDLINGNHIAISGLTSTAFYFIGSGSSPSPNIRSWFLTMTIIHDFDGNAETFFTQGPTIEPLLIQIFLTTQITNSVNYEFYTPNAGTSYFWNVCDYGSCSVSCGGGMQSREITCDEVVGGTQTVVDDSVCASNVGTKPDTTQSCNTVECPSWVDGDFGPCSQSCDTGMQSRDVECQYDGSTVADGLCEAEKPETTQSCNEFLCDADELCCEYIRSSSGTVERTAATEGRNCIITLIAPIGTTFELDNVDIDISCRLSGLVVTCHG